MGAADSVQEFSSGSGHHVMANLGENADDDHYLIARSAPVSPYMAILIDQGNTLTSGQDGIKYQASVATVPSAYDPNVTSSFVDGIGRGTLYIDGVAQSGYVLVANTSSGLLSISLLTGDTIAVGGTVAIPISGGGGATVTAYTAAWL